LVVSRVARGVHDDNRCIKSSAYVDTKLPAPDIFLSRAEAEKLGHYHGQSADVAMDAGDLETIVHGAAFK
jgi:hypothetical protein